eukprot:gnl/TRDRNA2_/TRDRNA2_107137_c1_seq1.p2 gnl/TRDRNA2_/TRDRNA2_107137_c1~~gnl/TRDRNA2_/TRDRNA2_107137_c1_seq1.p2  ORF type:complete len:186 (+),score=31.83 gnl/TRDRNA2_/TRDRNA2_107137_c1_seq1:261-818(+)
MVDCAGKSVAETAEMRYDLVREKVRKLEEEMNLDHTGMDDDEEFKAVVRVRKAREALLPLQKELAMFGGGPPEDLGAHTAERTEWFNKWFAAHFGSQTADGNEEVGESLLHSNLATTVGHHCSGAPSHPGLQAIAALEPCGNTADQVILGLFALASFILVLLGLRKLDSFQKHIWLSRQPLMQML